LTAAQSDKESAKIQNCSPRKSTQHSSIAAKQMSASDAIQLRGITPPRFQHNNDLREMEKMRHAAGRWFTPAVPELCSLPYIWPKLAWVRLYHEPEDALEHKEQEEQAKRPRLVMEWRFIEPSVSRLPMASDATWHAAMQELNVHGYSESLGTMAARLLPPDVLTAEHDLSIATRDLRNLKLMGVYLVRERTDTEVAEKAGAMQAPRQFQDGYEEWKAQEETAIQSKVEEAREIARSSGKEAMDTLVAAAKELVKAVWPPSAAAKASSSSSSATSAAP
jgi:hypothetical protein